MRVKVVEFNDNWKKLLEFLESWKKNNLEEFCLKKCNAECCREMEHSGINEDQIRLIFKLSKKDSLSNLKNRYGQSMIRKDDNGLFYTDMCYGVYCPSLNDKNLCSIYKNPLKPKYCDDFPFYCSEIDGVSTLEMEKCPATLNMDLSELKKAAKNYGIELKYIKKIKEI